jgi:hypothetical protein
MELEPIRSCEGANEGRVLCMAMHANGIAILYRACTTAEVRSRKLDHQNLLIPYRSPQSYVYMSIHEYCFVLGVVFQFVADLIQIIVIHTSESRLPTHILPILIRFANLKIFF